MIMVRLALWQCAVVGTRGSNRFDGVLMLTPVALLQAPTSKPMVGKMQADVKTSPRHLCKFPR